MSKLKLLCSVLMLASLTACGGGGAGGGSTVMQGTFIDSPVQGLTFGTASRNSLTDASGTFSYIEGEQVGFAVGGTMLGTATGASVITPLSLVPSAKDETNDFVTNRLIFLQTLDDDANPANGIVINPSVQAALTLTTLNLDMPTAAFIVDPDVIALFARLTPLTAAGLHSMVAPAAAQGNFRAYFAPKYASTQVIHISGQDTGAGTLTINGDGTVTLLAASSVYPSNLNNSVGVVHANGTVSIDCGTVAAASNPGSYCGTFTGTVTAGHTSQGTWKNSVTGATGTWSGSTSDPVTGKPLASAYAGMYTVTLAGQDTGTGMLSVDGAGVTMMLFSSGAQAAPTSAGPVYEAMEAGLADTAGNVTLTVLGTPSSKDVGASDATFTIRLLPSGTAIGTWTHPITHASGTWTATKNP